MAEGRARGVSIATGDSASERAATVRQTVDESVGSAPAVFPIGTRDELETVPAQTSVYQSQELPKLDVGPADDSIRENAYVPLVPRRLRTKLLLAVLVLPLVGAAAVILFMQLTA